MKLFKGQKAGPPGSAGNNPVAQSFNEQLMNQTNFGYNPARNTLVQNQPYDGTSFESISGQRQLNT